MEKNGRRRIKQLLCAGLIVFGLWSGGQTEIGILKAEAAWKKANWKWQYEEAEELAVNQWKEIGGSWYRFDKNGDMMTGWFQDELGKWYFLRNDVGSEEGKMAVGWNWINGRCYYLDPADGHMHFSGITPDGFQVNESGAWVKDGEVQWNSEAGFWTKTALEDRAEEARRIHSGSSGKGGGGSGGSSKRSSSRKEDGNPESPSMKDKGEDHGAPEEPKADERKEEVIQSCLYNYRILFKEVRNGAVISVVLGQAEAGGEIDVGTAEPEGYEICECQETVFTVTQNGQEFTIWCRDRGTVIPSDSNAREVSWTVSFVNRDDEGQEIFEKQSGVLREGETLSVTFPETLIGTDGYYWNSVLSSPWETVLYGTGTQKYRIEYIRGKRVEEDSESAERKQLEDWIWTAKENNSRISGREPEEQPDSAVIVETEKENNQILSELVSMAGNKERYEIYLIGRGYIPSTLILARKEGVQNISNVVMAEYILDGTSYTISKIGFERKFDPESCRHEWTVREEVRNGCTEAGTKYLECGKCREEVWVAIPADGHRDKDLDGFCDICGESAQEEAEPVRFEIGDKQARTIGNEIYIFTCIDDDYTDTKGNARGSALFLCDSVIRSDIVSTETERKTLSFGDTNNYKRSGIRKWLTEETEDSRFDMEPIFTGVNQAALGSTKQGTAEQFGSEDFMFYEIPFQNMTDDIFILSLEEASRYQEELFAFGGREGEMQVSPFSCGYWLRTPQYSGGGDGSGIYVVDLVNRNIHPAEVVSTAFGIRPAFTVGH